MLGQRMKKLLRRKGPTLKHNGKKRRQEPYHIEFIKDEFYSQFGKNRRNPTISFYLNFSDFVAQDQFKDSVNKSNAVNIQKLEVNDTINTIELVNTIDDPSPGEEILRAGNNTILVDNFANTNETIKDLNNLFTTDVPKENEGRVTDKQTKTFKTKTEVLNKTEDCTLLKWFFVCRDFRDLKDKDIFAV